MADKTKNPILEAEKRKLTGQKVKVLRREGLLPANIYGKKIKSLSVQAETKAVEKIFREAGETGLVDIKVKGEKEARPVLFHNPQFHPVSDSLLHIDFYQVDLTQKVTTDVPIEITGQSPAVDQGEGILMQILNEVEVEALPADLPEKFIIDISKLGSVGDTVTINNLKTDDKVKINAEKGQVVAKITAQQEEIEEAVVETEETVEGEGEIPAGEETEEKPAEEKPSEGKPKENTENK